MTFEVKLCGLSIILSLFDWSPPVVNLIDEHHLERHNPLSSLLSPN